MISRLCVFIVLNFVLQTTFSQKNLKGLEWEDEYYNSLPLKISYFKSATNSPASYSLKAYCPKAANQSGNTSVAWASVWFGRTILEAIRGGWKNNALITSQAFSPAFNYRLVSEETGCSKAVRLSAVLESLRLDGTVSFANFSEFCANEIPPELKNSAKSNKLPGYVKLFNTSDTKDRKVEAIKQAISEDHPVILGLIFPPAFEMAGEFWQPRGEPDRSQNGHAITVVGYDDSKFGGAIEVVNSWGGTWGQKGFSWFLYKDIETYIKYGYELLDISKNNQPLQVSLLALSDENNEMPIKLNASGMYQFKYSYPTGTKFNFNFTVNQPCFVYFIGYTSSWEYIILSPSESGISPWTPKGFLDFSIPGNKNNLELFDPPGRNFFCIIVSGSQIDIALMASQIKEEKENYFSAINESNAKGVEWSTDGVNFQMPFKRDLISAVLIELDQVPK